MPIDTMNKFFVGVQGDNVVFLRPIPQKISKADALLLAAWIVALADDSPSEADEEFKAVLDAVKAT